MAAPNNSTPFFGCKISLISKSEIRYEGILYTIDPKESTIALAKVKSFGSEDRPVDRPVPPRDEIFEFIIFRASDIKDLIVDEPQPSSLGDPAIIQAHSTSTSFPSSFPQASISSAQSGSLQQQLQRAGVQPARTAGLPESATVSSVPDSTKVKASTSSASSAAQAVKSTLATTSNNANKQPARNQFNQQQQLKQQQQSQNNRTQLDAGPGASAVNNMRSNANFVRKNPNQRPRNENDNSNFNQRNGHQNFRNFNNRFQYRMPMAGSFNRRPNTNRNFVNTKPAQKTFNPIPDFDFEKAQNEFQILEEKMSNMKMNGSGGDETGAEAEEETTTSNAVAEEEQPKESTYNKSKSFFDTVSCEAIEREKGNVQRVDWKLERKLNRETFGVVGNRRPNFRTNRGGYGGGQGYRGYNNYRNRNQQQRSPTGRNKTNGTSATSSDGTTTATAVPSTSTGSVTSSVAAVASTSTQPMATAVKN